MSSKKKKTEYDPLRPGRPMDVTAAVYVFYMLLVYACWMHDKYFDITGTRADVFIEGTGFFVIVFAMAFFFEYSLSAYYQNKLPIVHRDTHILLQPAVWMILFALANVMAFIMAPDKKAAWSGSDGRRFGLFMVLVLLAMILALTRGVRLPYWLIYVLALVVILAAAMAVIQHFGVDIFHMRANIKKNQQEKFISLFGNLNTYASYLAMVIPFFWGIMIFGKNWLGKRIAAIVLIVAAAGVIPAKSDNIYIGLAAACVFLLFLAMKYGKLLEWAAGGFFISAGLFMMAVMNRKYHGSKKHLNGAAELLENTRLMACVLAASAVFLLVVYLLKKKKPEWYDRQKSGRVRLILGALLALAAAFLFFLLRRAGSDLVTFNDKWGTYRGYVWRKAGALFRDAKPLNKLFGYGNETIRVLMKERYYEEMTSVTKQVYDNLHNELLQYLVTTGIFGLISYLGMFLTSIRFLVKRSAVSEVVPAIAAAGVGYFAQGLVNLNQPITTPYFFFALAVGIGLVRGQNTYEHG